MLDKEGKRDIEMRRKKVKVRGRNESKEGGRFDIERYLILS